MKRWPVTASLHGSHFFVFGGQTPWSASRPPGRLSSGRHKTVAPDSLRPSPWLRWLLAASLSAAFLLGQDFKLGSKVSDFTLKDTAGNAADFDALRGPVTVVVFVATQCPVSNAYNDRMNAIYKDYSARRVKFVFVNANRTEPAGQVAEHARQHLAFPVYKDENNVVADRFGASVTPEAYVIDSGAIVRYHGSIDDSQEIRRVSEQRLRNALDAVLANKTVERPETKAFGCSIKRVPKTT